jgi:hypothetical protein
MSSQVKRIEFIISVDAKAKELDRQRYNVKANIGGWNKPPSIEGYVPDFRAKRGEQIIIGKVLKEEDFDENSLDFKAFLKYAEKNENTSFRVYFTSRDGNPKLYKIY